MIKELLNTVHLTPQEQAIVDYIHQHPECIINYNAKELAELIYVSSPTVIRLAQKLGFQGYLDFKIAYTKEYSIENNQQHLSLTSQSSVSDIMETLPDTYYQLFLNTKNLTKKDAFIRTLNYMQNAKQIDFYANDNNYSEIQSACLKLNAIGIRAQAFNTLNTDYVNIIDPQEVLSFVVSHSGQNKIIMDAAYALRKKRAKVIAITGMTHQDLSLICNESLYIDTDLHNLPYGIMMYGLSIHYILDVLITSFILKKKL